MSDNLKSDWKEYNLYIDEFDSYQKKVVPAALGVKPEELGASFDLAENLVATKAALADIDAEAYPPLEQEYKEEFTSWASEAQKASKHWKELKKSFWQDNVSMGTVVGYNKKSWAKSIVPGIIELDPLPPAIPPIYTADYPYTTPIEAKAAPKPKKPRYPSYKKDDRVNTPEGLGNVWSVDRDGTVCVELDKDPSILHEFEKKELKKIKK